jgi:hypothetical protein
MTCRVLRDQLIEPYIQNACCNKAQTILLLNTVLTRQRFLCSPGRFWRSTLSLSHRRRSSPAMGLTGGIKGGCSTAPYSTPYPPTVLNRSDPPPTLTLGGGVQAARFHIEHKRTVMVDDISR